MAKVELYIAYIVDELRKGNGERGKVLAKFVKKWQTSARTFDRAWQKAQLQYQTLSSAIEKKKDEATTQAALNDTSNGLKSKSERLMNLQRQADDLQRMLDHNITPDIVKSPKQLEYMEIERKLTYVERATLMKSLRDLQGEISKIEGDYAPTKVDNKNENSGKIIVVRE